MDIKSLVTFGLGMMFANEEVREKAFKIGGKVMNEVGKQATGFIKENYKIDIPKMIDDTIKSLDDK